MISLRRYITHSLGRSLKIQPLTTIFYHRTLETYHIPQLIFLTPSYQESNLHGHRNPKVSEQSQFMFLKYKNQSKSPIDKTGQSYRNGFISSFKFYFPTNHYCSAGALYLKAQERTEHRVKLMIIIVLYKLRWPLLNNTEKKLSPNTTWMLTCLQKKTHI